MSEQERVWTIFLDHNGRVEDGSGLTPDAKRKYGIEVCPLERARIAEKRAEETERWYAVRIERITDAAKAAGIWPEIATILANGTAEVTEPPPCSTPRQK